MYAKTGYYVQAGGSSSLLSEKKLVLSIFFSNLMEKQSNNYYIIWNTVHLVKIYLISHAKNNQIILIEMMILLFYTKMYPLPSDT